MKHFYPGPSCLYPEIQSYVNEAFASGLLSMNHRSHLFSEVMYKAVGLLKERLCIPVGYEVFFVSSATECWEITAQSLDGLHFVHIFNGAFGEKWFHRTSALLPNCHFFDFNIEEEFTALPIFRRHEDNVICLVQNETSNGTQIKSEVLEDLKLRSPQSMLAIDATSSLGGIELPWSSIDLCFASVQKCLGLPAGLAVLVCSPELMHKAVQLGHKRHYNSLINLQENMLHFQPTHTPNMLGIYLLMRALENSPSILQTSQRIRQQAADWYSFLEEAGYRRLVENPDVLSDTVIAIHGEDTAIATLKKAAQEAGFYLGNGYGRWKHTTVRIANFPAIAPHDIAVLQEFLRVHAHLFA
jgi:phosphoserine aminotransferase